MNVEFAADTWDEYLWFQEYEPKLVKKLNHLIEECRRTPFEGTGKPEPLKYEFTGHWSRRITDQHRLVYRVENDELLMIVGCRFHYDQ